MHEQDLYIKKPNGRYQKVDYRFIDVVRIPNDKQVMVIKHSKNGKSFYYDSIDVKEEELKLLAKTRVYKDTLTNIILLHSAPKFTFGNGSWNKRDDESNKLTPVQLDAWERLKSVLDNRDFTLMFNSKFDIIEDALEEFLKMIESNNE